MKSRHNLSHQLVFLIGCTYYFFAPLILGYVGAFNSLESLSFLDKYFEPNDVNWPFLVTFIFFGTVSYLLGAFCINQPKTFPKSVETRRSHAGTWTLFFLYGLAMLMLAFQARVLLFSGYSNMPDSGLVGPIATLQMFLLFQYLYERSAHCSIASAFALLLIINSYVLLSMGGRLYVISALAAIYFRWWNWGADSKRTQLRSLLLVLFVILVSVVIGMWRVGESDYSSAIFYLTAEANLISISAFTLFTGGNWLPIDAPFEFLLSFTNLIPSVLWPEKSEWLASFINTMQNYQTPFGGVSIIASTISNFGYIGGLLFFFTVGLCMSKVGCTRSDPAREARYSCLVGMLPFMFFRDPFQVQVKIVLIFQILYLITRILKKRNFSSRHEGSTDLFCS
ncbi:hypothetical protein G6680_05020 [Polynucleobacter paneuropaeus]|nr:hypothetical protein [Polynucleobacter paneuropaeus]